MFCFYLVNRNALNMFEGVFYIYFYFYIFIVKRTLTIARENFFFCLTYNKWKFIPFSWTRMCQPKQSDEMSFFVDMHNWSYYSSSIKSLIMNHPTRCCCHGLRIKRIVALHFTISNKIFHSFLLLRIGLLLTQLSPYNRTEHKYLKIKNIPNNGLINIHPHIRSYSFVFPTASMHTFE